MLRLLSLSSCLRLDYVSCLLTVVSTLLVGRKQWTGLLLGSLNSLLICAIGWRTAQFGFIPANLFCIGIYGFSIRSWLRETAPRQPIEAGQNAAESGAAGRTGFIARSSRRCLSRRVARTSSANICGD